MVSIHGRPVDFSSMQQGKLLQLPRILVQDWQAKTQLTENSMRAPQSVKNGLFLQHSSVFVLDNISIVCLACLN